MFDPNYPLNPSPISDPKADLGAVSGPTRPRREFEWGSMESIVLENGLTAHVVRMHDRRLTYQKLLYPFGASIELPHERGLSHLLEHVMSEARGNFSSTAARDEFLAHRAIRSDACTSPFSVTAYHDSLSGHAMLAGELLASGYPQGVVTEEALEKHRRIVLQEFNLYLPSHEAMFDYMTTEWLNPDPRFCLPLGDRSVVESATLGQLGDLHRRTYATFRPELLLVGDVPSELLELWGRVRIRGARPGDLKEASLVAPEDLQSPWGRSGDGRIRHFADTTRTGLNFTFLLPASAGLKGAAVGVAFCSLLHGDLSSPLMLQLREKEQLLYSMDLSRTTWRDYGTFKFRFTAQDCQTACRIVRGILEVTRALVTEGISDRLWGRHQNRMKRSHATTQYNAVDLADVLESSLRISGDLIPTSDFQQMELAVTREELIAVAQRAIAPGVGQLIVKGQVTDPDRALLLAAMDS